MECNTENATEGEGIQNTPIAEYIAGERTETAAESAADSGRGICWKCCRKCYRGNSRGSRRGRGECSRACISLSVRIQRVIETPEDGTDHTIRIERETKEGAYKFNTRGEAAMEAVNQLPKVRIGSHTKMDTQFGTQKEGILGHKILAAADIIESRRWNAESRRYSKLGLCD